MALHRGAMLSQQGGDVDIIMHSKLLNRYVERPAERAGNGYRVADVASRGSMGLWGRGNGRYRIPEKERWLPDFTRDYRTLLKEGETGKALKRCIAAEPDSADEGQGFS